MLPVYPSLNLFPYPCAPAKIVAVTRFIFLFLSLSFLSACASIAPEKERALASEELVPWKTSGGIDTGVLENGLILVRANPLLTPLELVNPPESAGNVAQVAKNRGLSVVINAAMFARDYVTSIGYMRNFTKVNNPQMSSKMRGFLMFNPKNASLPAVRIGDKSEIGQYNTVFQTHRMWSAQEGILWKKGASIYHHVGLVGVDGKNRILFFYQPDLSDVHDLVAKILTLGLDLKGLLYLDGGNHGALHLSPDLGRGANTWISLPNLLGIKANRN